MWKQSKCVGAWLHRYVILRQSATEAVEVCKICHKKAVFKIRGGRVNNLEYLYSHLRSALQRYHPRFKKEYGR